MGLAEVYSKQAHLTSGWIRILAYELPKEERQAPRAVPRKLSQRLAVQQIHEILDGYEAGLDSRQLGRKFGISPQACSEYFIATGSKFDAEDGDANR